MDEQTIMLLIGIHMLICAIGCIIFAEVNRHNINCKRCETCTNVKVTSNHSICYQCKDGSKYESKEMQAERAELYQYRGLGSVTYLKAMKATFILRLYARKVEADKKTDAWMLCPSCKKELNGELWEAAYCPDCGQKLDWRLNDD